MILCKYNICEAHIYHIIVLRNYVYIFVDYQILSKLGVDIYVRNLLLKGLHFVRLYLNYAIWCGTVKSSDILWSLKANKIKTTDRKHLCFGVRQHYIDALWVATFLTVANSLMIDQLQMTPWNGNAICIAGPRRIHQSTAERNKASMMWSFANSDLVSLGISGSTVTLELLVIRDAETLM